MSLREDIHLAQLQAMKDRNAELTSVLRGLWSALRNEEIDKQHDLTDSEVQVVIARQVKQLEDAMKDFEKGNREDLVAKTKTELQTLRSYLPTQLTDTELETIVRTAMNTFGTIGAADVGKVTGVVMKEVKGKADGNRVKATIERLIAA